MGKNFNSARDFQEFFHSVTQSNRSVLPDTVLVLCLIGSLSPDVHAISRGI